MSEVLKAYSINNYLSEYDYDPIIIFANKDEAANVKGCIYRLGTTRGKLNRGIIKEDLEDGRSLSLKGLIDLPLLYDHGKDPRFNFTQIGKVTDAYIDGNDMVMISAKIFQGDRIPSWMEDTIRRELLEGVLAMFSLRWDGSDLGDYNGELIANPYDRHWSEVSLCRQGKYPEARLISVAASVDQPLISRYLLLTSFRPGCKYKCKHRIYNHVRQRNSRRHFESPQAVND